MKGALARPMVVLKMFRIRAVPNSPLCSLLNGKESELAIAFARRSLPFPHLGTHAFWRFSGPVAHKQHLLQTRHRLLRATNDYSVAHRRAIVQDVLVDGIESREATPFRRSGHHRAFGCPRNVSCSVDQFWLHTHVPFSRPFLARHIHIVVMMFRLMGWRLSRVGLWRGRLLL